MNVFVNSRSENSVVATIKKLILMSFCCLSVEAAELELGIGGFATSLPKYIGSNERNNYALPFPYIYYKSDRLELDRNAFTGFIWRKNNWYLDVSASGSIPVKSNNTKVREAMPDINFVGEIGPVLKYYFIGDINSAEQLLVGFHTRKAFSIDLSSIKTVGWSYGPSIQYSQNIAPFSNGNLSLDASLNIDFSDDNYLNFYYGVSEQYAKLERETFEMESGYKGSSLSLGFTWDNDKIWLGSFIKYNTLGGAKQQDSPLVKKDNNWSIGLGLVWIFYHE